MKRCTRVGQIKRSQVRFSGGFGFELPENTKKQHMDCKLSTMNLLHI